MSTPVLDLRPNWNEPTTSHVGLQLTVTDTQSAAASKFLELSDSAQAMFSVQKDGTIFARDRHGTAAIRDLSTIAGLEGYIDTQLGDLAGNNIWTGTNTFTDVVAFQGGIRFAAGTVNGEQWKGPKGANQNPYPMTNADHWLLLANDGGVILPDVADVCDPVWDDGEGGLSVAYGQHYRLTVNGLDKGYIWSTINNNIYFPAGDPASYRIPNGTPYEMSDKISLRFAPLYLWSDDPANQGAIELSRGWYVV